MRQFLHITMPDGRTWMVDLKHLWSFSTCSTGGTVVMLYEGKNTFVSTTPMIEIRGQIAAGRNVICIVQADEAVEDA